jgi:gliding motility-associated-like protein
MKFILQKYLPFIILICIHAKAFSGEIKTPEPQNTIRFTENKNQWDKKIIYAANLDGGTMFLEKNCFTYSFYDKEAVETEHQHGASYQDENYFKNARQQTSSIIKSHAFRMTFVNALTTSEIASKKATPDYCNYFIGNDKSKWVGNAKNYKEVNYKGLYNHIDLEILGLQNSVKYNFYVAPQGNANQIQLFYEGLNSISLEKGALKLTTSVNELYEQRPYAYQWVGSKRVDVPCEFVLENTTVHFNFPQGYNKNYELVIDPVLVFAASSGSVANNFGHTGTYDEQGNLYSGGIAFGQKYPTTPGAYDNSFNGIVDVVLTKYDATGTFLHYSTYLGGAAGTEIVTSLIVDAQNNLYLYGVTGSTDFPVTANGYDISFNGGIYYYPHSSNGNIFNVGTDIYVAKFNNTGSSLLASTYIGGSNNDGINSNTIELGDRSHKLDSLQYDYGDYYRGEIDMDNVGNIIVATASRSKDFPIVNGFDNTLGGLQDAVVFKLNNSLSQLIWSTYLGGSEKDCANGLVIDNASNVYVTGGTCSNDFPTTAGVKQSAFAGGVADGYVTKIKQDGTSILTSTYWGTSGYDQSFRIQLDKKNNAYTFGQTDGIMPVTAGVYSNANSGQFITKMDNMLTTVIYSTIFGNGNHKPNISPTAFLVDNCENVYVSGWACGYNRNDIGLTTGMPTTPDANDKTTDGYDFYLMALTTNASSLLYATYFGGGLSREHVHGGTSRYDKKGIVYQSLCTGCTDQDDFPGTAGSWPHNGSDWNGSGGCNNGVFKLDFQVPLANANFTVDRLSGCAPLTVNFSNQSPVGVSYKWDFGKNDTTSAIRNPIKIYDSVGTYQVKLYINNPATCNVTDTVLKLITVYPPYKADFNFTTQPCSNQFAFQDSSMVAPVSWLWHFDDGDSSMVQNPQHSYDSIGKYNVQLISTTINGCKDTAIVQVDNTTAAVSVNNGLTICKSNTTQLSASGGIAYQWTPSSSLTNPAIANPIANPDTTTTYTVTITSVNAIGDTCHKNLTTQIKVFDPSLYFISAIADKDTIYKGESTILHALTDTTLTVRWSSPSGFVSPNNFNQPVSPEQTTTYTVTLVGANGCEKSAMVSIFIKSKDCDPANIFVPNTFTPNGDGKNDILFVRGNEIEELYFAVYNRWGQMVFETNTITKGWDGNYNNMKTDPAVFAWYIRAKCYNGSAIEKKGNVTLIR